MDNNQNVRSTAGESDSRMKIREALFGDFPLSSREDLYRIIGIVLLGLGLVGCFAVYWPVGPRMWLAIAIPVCVFTGLEFGDLSKRKRMERFRKLFHDLDRQKPG